MPPHRIPGRSMAMGHLRELGNNVRRRTDRLLDELLEMTKDSGTEMAMIVLAVPADWIEQAQQRIIVALPSQRRVFAALEELGEEDVRAFVNSRGALHHRAEEALRTRLREMLLEKDGKL